MFELSLTNLTRLGLTHAVNATSAQTGLVECLQENRAIAFGELRKIGAGEFLTSFSGPLARDIQAYGVTAVPETDVSPEDYVLGNHLRLGCLIYALPRGLVAETVVDQALVALGVRPRTSFTWPASPLTELIAAHRSGAFFAGLIEVIGLDVVADYLVSKGSAREEALRYLARKSNPYTSGASLPESELDINEMRRWVDSIRTGLIDAAGIDSQNVVRIEVEGIVAGVGAQYYQSKPDTDPPGARLLTGAQPSDDPSKK